MRFIEEHVGEPREPGLRWSVESICAQLTQLGAKIAPATYYEHRGRRPTVQEVDLRGWRPAPVTSDGTARPGITGLLDAEHNMLVHLGTFPDPRSLRVVLDSQRIVSRTAAMLVAVSDPDHAVKWHAREATYTRLVHQTRDLGGQLGDGRLSAGQGSAAAAHVQRLKVSDFADPAPVRQLDQLFAQVDERVSQILERGASERLYLLRVPLPRIDENAVGLVKPPRARYIPITSPVGPGLLDIAPLDRRPEPPKPRPPTGAARSRAELEAAILHRPDSRSDAGAIGM